MEWHCQSRKFEEQERVRYHDYSVPQSTLPVSSVRNKDQWMEIARQFSARKITLQSDRLPALSGFSHSYAAQTHCEFLAGLWPGPDLIDLLLWFRVTDDPESSYPTVPQSSYIAPTWSWLAANTAVDFRRFSEPSYKHIAMVSNYSVTLKATHPFGEITHGHLDISAPAIRTSLAAIMDVNKHRPSASRMNSSEYLQKVFPEHMMNRPSCEWTWPRFHLDKSHHDRGLKVHCVILGYEWWSTEVYGMYGIIVTPISSAEQTFRRLGMFTRLPKFQSNDQGPNRRDMMKRELARRKVAIMYDADYTSKHRATLLSLYPRRG